MSGPKSYDYWVDYETEEEIRERMRRQKEEEELRLAKNKLTATLNNLYNSIDQASSVIDKIDETIVITGKVITAHVDSKNLVKEMREYVTNCRNLRFDKINDVNKCINQVQDKLKSVENEKNKMQNLLSKCADEVSDEMDNKVSDVEIKFSFLEKKEEVNPYPDLIKEELKNVEGLVFSKQLYEKQESIQNMLETVSGVSEYKSLYSIMTIPFVKECIDYNNLYNKLIVEYEVLCKENSVNVLTFDNYEDPVEVLDKEIRRLETEILEKKKQEYITECLEETMEEMGYELVGERNVVKKSGKKFLNKLYKFDDDTVVNVTIQDNGQISMELGGVDVVDRTATSAEAAALVSDMEKFCSVNEEIQKNLKKKGINGRNILHMPPTAEYAQIINVEKYQLSGNVEKIKSGKRNKAKKPKEVKLLREE